MKTIAISIEEELLKRIDRFTKGTGDVSNRSKLIRAAVREHLGRLERSAEEQREKEVFRKNRKKLDRQAAALVREQAKA